MKIPIYLALSPAEFFVCEVLPPRPAWMACHFSPGGDGLSNIPHQLPSGSLLILDDSAPYQEHDCELILAQLTDAIASLQPDALLLDFQRPHVDAVQALAKRISDELPCLVAVSACYAESLTCPIFLPPGPPYMPLADYLKPYQGREIWLDAAPVFGQMVVTTDGTQYTSHANELISESKHFDDALHCHYGMKIEENRIIFNFSRSCNDLPGWLEEAEKLGVACAVGLHQELGSIFKQTKPPC